MTDQEKAGTKATYKNSPSHVALIGTCPHCGEAVEMVISKAEAKTIFKAFKLSVKRAQLYSENKIHGRLLLESQS